MSMSTMFYAASTMPLGDGTVTSTTSLFIPKMEGFAMAPSDVVCFVGSAVGLEPDIASVHGGGGEDCSAANGCGVHVHAGMGCEDKEAQGGHWWNPETMDEDPWKIVGYSATDAEGYGQYASCVHTGYDLVSDPSLLVGHAFIVHGEDGGRVSCGIIEETPDYAPTSLFTELPPIPGVETKAEGMVTVLTGFDVSDASCYIGCAMGLEPDIDSFLLGTGSDQCDAPNGCGAHIHSGTGCADKEAQGGHYFDAEDIAEDPWKFASYYKTNSEGEAAMIGCALTGAGAAEYEAKPFIVHNPLGGRVLCGVLEEPPPEESASATRSIVAALASILMVFALW